MALGFRVCSSTVRASRLCPCWSHGLPGRTRMQQHKRSMVHARAEARASDVGKPLLLLELEGVVIDMHMDGHRVAFNQAFQDLGYDCIQWPVQVYNDLLSCGDGSPDMLITNYFQMMGWPTMLATSDQGSFVKKVHAAKQQALARMLMAGQVPLRPGVEQVMVDAVQSGAQVAWLTGTLSEASDLIAKNALSQLPPAEAGTIQDDRYRVASSRQDNTQSGQEGTEQMTLDGSEETLPPCPMKILREQQAQTKYSKAAEFVSGISADNTTGTPILAMHPALLAQASRQVSPEWLAAITAMLGGSCSQAVLLTSSTTLIEAATSAGIKAVAIPRKMAARGTFTGAVAKFSGFGPGECTWGRLQQFIRPATPSTSHT